MKKIIAASFLLLFLFLFTASIAHASNEFQQRDLIHRYLNYPIEDWEKLTKANKKLLDDNLLKIIKSMMGQVLKKGMEKNLRSDDIPPETFLYAYLADYIGKKIKKPEQNRYWLARLYEVRGRYDKSADICNNILLEDPKNVEVMTFQADLFERMNMPKEAFDLYQRILKIDKKNKIALFHLGLMYIELARYNDAIHFFRKLLKIDPDNKVAQRFVDMYDGKIKGKTPEVKRNEKAIQHFLIAEKMFKSGKYKAASMEYTNAIEADPTFAKAYVYLGETLMRLKKYDSAIGVLESSVKLDAKDPEAYHLMGQAYERQYNFNPDPKLLDLAIKNYRKALEIDITYYKASDDLARALQRYNTLQDKEEVKQNNVTPEK